ncbi:MAG: tRNA pseudouridine(38-40) synthase TruA [Verrucomicrobiae bacterium]|nr:tRNA pseudouridine(38-40) synthase TruA [Verrucomicrobiae bacterium]
MTRWKCTCSYDGTDFTGWQSQPTRDAVQDVLEAGFAKIFKLPVRIHGSGRTDAGVHALAQVFHFDADWSHGPEKLSAAINALLPPSIRVYKIETADPSFHARYSAFKKRYHYRIFFGQADPFETRYCLSLPFPLDTDAMQQAGKCLLGQHDFSAFSAENGADPEKENPVKDFRLFEINAEGSRLRLTFEASGFMYKMVRSLTGALIRVGRGKLSPEAFEQILQSRVRTKDVITASPQGLFLEKVDYTN